MAPLFVVERYDDTGSPDLTPLPAPPADVKIVCAIRVPADDVLVALVEGVDEQVTQTRLVGVGWRIDRITPATWVRPGEGTA